MTTERKLLLKYLLKEYREQSLKILKENIDRPLSTIALQIQKEWKDINSNALSYLIPMRVLKDMSSRVGRNNGASIVTNFLVNSLHWKTPKAKEIKTQLKRMLDAYYKKTNYADFNDGSRELSIRNLNKI